MYWAEREREREREREANPLSLSFSPPLSHSIIISILPRLSFLLPLCLTPSPLHLHLSLFLPLSSQKMSSKQSCGIQKTSPHSKRSLSLSLPKKEKTMMKEREFIHLLSLSLLDVTISALILMVRITMTMVSLLLRLMINLTTVCLMSELRSSLVLE